MAFNGLIKSPCRMVVSGQSGSGKSVLITKILLNHEQAFERTFKRIYIFYEHDQEAYRLLQKESKIPVSMIHGVPSPSFEPIPGTYVTFFLK